jgi:hypothetical protein
MVLTDTRCQPLYTTISLLHPTCENSVADSLSRSAPSVRSSQDLPNLRGWVNNAGWCQLGEAFSTPLSPCRRTAFQAPSSRRKIRVARIISSLGSGRLLNWPRQRSMKTP